MFTLSVVYYPVTNTCVFVCVKFCVFTLQVYHSLQRQTHRTTPLKGPGTLGPGLSLGLPATLAHPGHKHRPEVVTTSNRIQESCI